MKARAWMLIQVGQAGNQIGGEFWRLAACSGGLTSGQFDGVKGTGGEDARRARCVMVDSEPRVVAAYGGGRLVGAPGVVFDATLHEQSGRGGNWASGYAGREFRQHKGGRSSGAGMAVSWRGAHGGGVLDGDAGRNEADALPGRVVRALRGRLEARDWGGQGQGGGGDDGVVLVHSLAGGTGSGTGSRIAEVVREEYPSECMVSVCAGPLVDAGLADSPLQYVNACLAIAKLQEHTDGVLLFRNGDVLRGLAKGRAVGATEPTLKDVNRYIAATLGGLLFPAPPVRRKGEDAGIENDPIQAEGIRGLTELVRSVVSDPAHKFLEARTWPPPPAAPAAESLGKVSARVGFGARGSQVRPAWNSDSSVKRTGANSSVQGGVGSGVGGSGDTGIGWAGAARKLGTSFVPRFDPQLVAAEVDESTGEEVLASCPSPVRTSRVRVIYRGCGAHLAETAETDEATHVLCGQGSMAPYGLAASPAGVDVSVIRTWTPAASYRPTITTTTAATAISRKPGLSGRGPKSSAGTPVPKSLTVLANRSNAAGYLGRIADRARAMALAGAYMHWFEAQGVSRDDVLEAADVVQDLAEGYLAWYY